MDPSEITKYKDMALTRKYWIIIPLLISLLVGLCYFLKAPKIYEAQTLILVQPQRVPEEFVRPIVSVSVEDRLMTISQQVTSRTNLEKIIREYQLLGMPGSSLDIDPMVSAMRSRITIDVRGGGRGRETSTFTIAFRGKDPKTVMRVTNALASNFIAENLKIREEQALGTSLFLAGELDSVRNRLLEKETELKDYRERYMGGLPEQLQTNLTIIQRLQTQLDQLNDNLRDAGNRKAAIQTQITEQSNLGPQLTLSPTGQPTEARDIQSLRNELASLEARYTPKHPDIIRLKETIATLERQESEASGNSDSAEESSIPSRVNPVLKSQLQDVDLEIAGLKDEIKKMQSEINRYQKKVEDTPKREQELLSLNRDYENIKEIYSSLLNRKLEAEIAVSMEKKQKGEQFRVIDPAKIPSYPVEPDMMQILFLTLALGLGLGCGLAYLTELLDSSYKDPDEVEKELQIPVLISVPIHYTDQELRDRKVKELIKAGSVAVGFIVCAVGIIFVTRGIDATVNYVKTILDRI